MTKNFFKSNTGHGGEQQLDSRNPRQANFHNVITFQQTNSIH